MGCLSAAKGDNGLRGEKLEGRKAIGKKGLRGDRLENLKGWRGKRHEGREA